MIPDFLAFEIPWQRYDAARLLRALALFSVPGVFFSQENTRELVLPMVAPILEKFEQIL